MRFAKDSAAITVSALVTTHSVTIKWTVSMALMKLSVVSKAGGGGGGGFDTSVAL